jgi:hypothetical protein
MQATLLRQVPTLTNYVAGLDYVCIYICAFTYTKNEKYGPSTVFDILSGIYFDILSDILSGILSGTYFDILSGILSSKYSDALSGISSGIL